MPHKREQREQREQDIVGQAIGLMSGKGFLAVRMSDIATASRLAIGTIYTHFETMEDLLLACAVLLAEEQKAIYTKIIASGAPAMERIVAGFTINWLIAQHHPDLTEIESLSLMPSIWRRASSRRVEQLNALHADFSDMAGPLLRQILVQDLANQGADSRLGLEQLAAILNHGMWGLCIGLNSTAQSGLCRNVGAGRRQCTYLHFTTNVIHFLQGYGWREPEPEAMFDRCQSTALECLRGSRWFACPTPIDASVEAVLHG